MLPEAKARGATSLRLWHERKGQGGKTVTLVAGFASGDHAQPAAAHLRRALGCGAQVEGEQVVLQGDQRQRAQAVLSACGVMRACANGSPPATRR
jgi:translation initiation factor 1